MIMVFGYLYIINIHYAFMLSCPCPAVHRGFGSAMLVGTNLQSAQIGLRSPTPPCRITPPLCGPLPMTVLASRGAW